MKSILVFLSFIFTLSLNAQYIITATTNPVAGDIESSVDTYTSGLTQPVSGTNKLWNYASLSLNFSSTSSSTYIPISTVPNNSLFAGANLGVMYGPNAYEALKINSSSRTDLGGAATTASDCTVFSDPFIYMTLPFGYGSGYADNITYSTSIDALSGIANVSGSGTGTLIIPGFTFNNVLKVTTTINYTYTSGASVATVLQSQHSFYSAVNKFALLTIYSSTVTQGSSTSTSIGASINQACALGVGIEEIANENDLNVYPNPVNGNETIFINFINKESKDVNLVLLNAIGQVIKESNYDNLSSGENKLKMDLKNIPPGIYSLQIKTGGTESVKKLIIE